MQAAIYQRFGKPKVLQIKNVEKVTITDEHEDRILIKVYSASVNPYDYLFRSGFLPTRIENGWMKPKQQILGIDSAGIVEEVGRKVTRFKPGDRVFGNGVGSHAEYVRLREDRAALLPRNLTFDEAAAIPTAALTALQALRDLAKIQKGQKVLVYGASGGIGHFAVQLAKYYGTEVTAITSTSNLGWVKNLGADHVIDYTKEDFAKNGQKYNLIFDSVGKRTYFSCKSALTETGLYITENPFKARFQFTQLLFSMITRDERIKMHLAQANAKDMDLLKELAEAGTIKPMIEKVFSLAEIAAAHHHVESRHTKGKIIIQIKPN